MERIEGQAVDQKELAKQVLSWITCAKRPLTTTQLQHALAIEVGELELDEDNLPQIEDMVSVCAGLVIVDEQSGIIRLVHYTTQNYFERTQDKWFPSAQAQIATACVTYLSSMVFESGPCLTDDKFEERLRMNPLYDYTAKNWGYHAQSATWPIPCVMEFLGKRPQVDASSQALLVSNQRLSIASNYSQSYPKDRTATHLAAYFGVNEAVTELLEAKNDADSKDQVDRTPLSIAAEQGHEAIVKLLLAQGADPDSKNTHGWTPLIFAIGEGHKAIIKLLLAQGANADLKDKKGFTPLILATWQGHEAIVKLLLAQGADTDSKVTSGYYQGWTSLIYAAEQGHKDVAKLLLAEGADIELKDRVGRTPLSFAAWHGHEAIIKLLLAQGANVHSKATQKFYKGRTPLSFAAGGGHEAIIQLLLAYGANINEADKRGNTPLSFATRNGHKAVVKMLLTQGANT
jgi:ankyrin repeat protein